MLHLAFREKLWEFLITKRPIPNKTEHLEEAKKAQTFATLLPFGFHLLCEPAANLLLCSSQSCHDGIVSSSHLRKEFEILTVLLFCILQADFKLMCDNAMTYNRPDTVYYKLAKKILHTGFKMMSKVRDLLKTKSRNSLGFFFVILKRNIINNNDKCYFIHLWLIIAVPVSAAVFNDLIAFLLQPHPYFSTLSAPLKSVGASSTGLSGSN